MGQPFPLIFIVSVIQGQHLVLELRQSGIDGLGVYTLSYVPQNTLVITCQGKELSTHQLNPNHHAMQISEDLWLSSDGSNIDDYINHSCEPNLGFKCGDLGLYSLRDISAGEEIFWDYSTSIAEEGWNLECHCGSRNCRGTILPFFSLSPLIKKNLLPITLSYIRRLFDESIIHSKNYHSRNLTKPVQCYAEVFRRRKNA